MRSFIVALFLIASACTCANATSRYVNTRRNFIFTIPVSPEYYYAVGDEDEKADRIAERIIKELKAQFKNDDKTEVLDKGLFSVVGKQGTEESQVKKILNDHCVQCHKPGSSKPGVQLFDLSRNLFKDADERKEKRRRELVYESIDSGEMPKGSAPLSPNQKSIIKKWAGK
jgi:mono/diheme cytochrome c family protein